MERELELLYGYGSKILQFDSEPLSQRSCDTFGFASWIEILSLAMIIEFLSAVLETRLVASEMSQTALAL